MTIKRETKTKIQAAATSTEPVRSESPRQLDTYGRFLPLEIGQRLNVSYHRGTKTHGRTRTTVVESKITARRRVRRAR